MKKLISFSIMLLFIAFNGCERALEDYDYDQWDPQNPIRLPDPVPVPVVPTLPNDDIIFGDDEGIRYLQPELIKEFLSSSEFLKLESYLCNYGNIGIGTVQNMPLPIVKGDSKGLEGVLLIPISMGNTPTACLQVIKVPEGNLPNKDIYFINLVDLRGVNKSTLTGEVKMIGLNYDFFQHTTIEIDKNVITSAKSFPLPLEYQEILAKGKLKDFLHCFRWAMHEVGNASLVFFYACMFPPMDIICIAPSALHCFIDVVIKDNDPSIYY